MITPQYTWSQRVQWTLAYEREQDAFARTDLADPESTYWTRDDVERLQCEIGQRLLREIPEEVLEQVGGTGSAGPPRTGGVWNDFANGDAIELAGVRIISATMQMAANGPFFPARLISTAEWVQLATLTAPAGERWFTIFGSAVIHSGYRLRLYYVVEPELSDFQSDAVFLPATGYIEDARDWVHHMLTAADWLPMGRI